MSQFIEGLTAYHRARPLWHASPDAQCHGECGLDCKDATSEFRTFTKNYSVFEAAIRCPKQEHPALALPHDSRAPEFYRLECCLKRKRNRTGDLTGEHLPDGADPCTECRPQREKLLPPTAAKRCKDESNDTVVAWNKYKDVDIGGGKVSNKLVKHHGTRAELVQQIEETAQEWAFHRWLKHWTK
jgi:hypothetical protein